MIFNLEVDTNNSFKAMGQMLKVYRMQSGYSLRDLGSLANLSHTLIANIEQGKISGNKDTIKHLFKVLNTEFFDSPELIENFVETYNKAFDYLYKYEYTRAKKEMSKLFEDENKYVHSILITDYALIKFFYLVLLEEKTDDGNIDLSLLKRASKNFSSRQKQLLYLIEGIDLYNRGFYHEANGILSKSLTIGVSSLDYLINVFKVKCYVKMFRFMDVIKVGNATIDFFEESVIYLRAMEVRLSIAYSYMLVRKFADARLMLDRVYQFATNFNAIYLIEESKILLGSLNLLEGNVQTAKEQINSTNKKTPIIYFLKMKINMHEKNNEKITSLYNEYKKTYQGNTLRKQNIILDLEMNEYGLLKMNKQVYVKLINELIELGVRACDLEVIELGYSFLIKYYKQNRMYKKALEASEIAREYRRYGCLKRKVL